MSHRLGLGPGLESGFLLVNTKSDNKTKDIMPSKAKSQDFACRQSPPPLCRYVEQKSSRFRMCVLLGFQHTKSIKSLTCRIYRSIDARIIQQNNTCLRCHLHSCVHAMTHALYLSFTACELQITCYCRNGTAECKRCNPSYQLKAL